MNLTERELEALCYLRSFHTRLDKQYSNYSPIDNLSNDELLSLYNKMDAIRKYEGDMKRSYGCYDEFYIFEFERIKASLSKIIKNRQISINDVKLPEPIM